MRVSLGFKHLRFRYSVANARRFKMTNSTSAPKIPPAGSSPLILDSEMPIEEELIPNYNPKAFFPVNPGDLLHHRFKIVAKLGWGTSSTVWLARDLHREQQADRHIVLKVNNCDFMDQESADHELKISQHVAAANPSHRGFPLVRTAIDSFEVKGPEGTHLCLVYEPMRESLRLFRRHFAGGKLPLPLLKGYLQIILMGLDYLHSEAQIIHTDLKLDNILVGFEDPSVIEDFVAGQVQSPMARKNVNGRSIYQSHNDFGPLRSLSVLPKIADFGLALSGNSTGLYLQPIQPDHYRAPEVLLGTGWTYSADIWNLGVLIWNFLENRDLFTKVHSAEGKYSGEAHIGEIIALLGPPPRKLIERERDGHTRKWGFEVENAEGKPCDSASTYYGGPFFDPNGEFIRKDLVPSHLNLINSITSLQGEEKIPFLAFIRKMLRWLPEERKTAKELLEDPWLNA